MFKVGIDTIGYYSPQYYLDLKTLAEKRGLDVEKFYVGLGQYKMAVPPPDEDIVTMAANAALRALRNTTMDDIETIMFATESGIDYSKSAGIYVHQLLGLPNRCRVIELKQACYGATAGLNMALAMIKQRPEKKILLIASDIARYGLDTTGESSQGGGAIAMLLTANPRIISIESGSGIHTEDVMDFWRPNYRDEALVDGKYSIDVYLRVLVETWKQYSEETGKHLSDIARFCYHTPVPRLVEKAHKRLARHHGLKDYSEQQLLAQVENTLHYAKVTGNCYTASLYLGLLSLLDHDHEDLSNQHIGFYSYGSGCVGEYFSGEMQPNYQQQLDTEWNQQLLAKRQALNYEQYQKFYTFPLPIDGSLCVIPQHNTGQFRLARIEQHRRMYERLS